MALLRILRLRIRTHHIHSMHSKMHFPLSRLRDRNFFNESVKWIVARSLDLIEKAQLVGFNPIDYLPPHKLDTRTDVIKLETTGGRGMKTNKDGNAIEVVTNPPTFTKYITTFTFPLPPFPLYSTAFKQIQIIHTISQHAIYSKDVLYAHKPQVAQQLPLIETPFRSIYYPTPFSQPGAPSSITTKILSLRHNAAATCNPQRSPHLNHIPRKVPKRCPSHVLFNFTKVIEQQSRIRTMGK